MSHIKTLVITQLKFAFAYLPVGCTYAAETTCFLLVLCAVWKFCLHKKIPRLFWWRLLVGFLFIAYMYCVLQLTILSREPGNFGVIDWRFLVRWNENDAQKAFLLANIIMFIPFGVLLPMFGKTMSHILIALPLAMACSVSIEALQLKYQLGFCQLDDVVANSVGFLIGFLIFLVIRVVERSQADPNCKDSFCRRSTCCVRKAICRISNLIHLQRYFHNLGADGI